MTDGKGATISDSEELNCVVVYQINQQNTWNLTYIVKKQSALLQNTQTTMLTFSDLPILENFSESI